MSSEWFYRSAGRDFGPVPFDRLRELASQNQLMPADEIRRGGSSEWIEAGMFPHLFENAPAAQDISVPGLADVSLDDFQIVTENEESRLATLDDRGIRVSEEQTARSPKSSAEDSEDQWICRVLGVQLGPMPLGDLKVLAKKGEISLDDEVRRADETYWRLAKTVDDLFPGFEFHSDDGIPVAHPQIVDDSQKLPELGDDIHSAIAGLPSVEIPNAPEQAKPAERNEPVKGDSPGGKPISPAAKPKRSKRKELEEWLSDAVPAPGSPPAAVEEPDTSQTAEPAAVESGGPSADRAAQLRAEYESRAAQVATYAPSPAVKPKPAKSSRTESRFQFSELLEKIKENPKSFGVFAVLAIVVIVKYVPVSFGLGDQAYLNQITQYTNKYKELRERKAPQTEMDQFKEEALAVIKPLAEELRQAGAGIADRPKQEMLWACGKFEELLDVGESERAGEVESTLNAHIRDAQSMIR